MSDDHRARRRIAVAALAILLFLVLLVFFIPGKKIEGPALAGEIDASGIGDQAIVLAGEWEILEDGRDPGAAGGYAFLPGAWKDPYGYAAYRIRAIGLDPNRTYALSTSYIDTSYRLWAGERLLIAGGRPGRSAAETVAAYKSETKRLPEGISEIELKLEVANFVHKRGGPYKGILLGDASYLERYASWSLVTELLTIAIMISLAGIAFLSAALRKSPGSLCFGLMLISGAVGLFTLSPDFPAFRFFPDLDWESYAKSAYVIVYAVPLWLFLTARSLFGGFSARATALVSLPTALLALFAIAAPSRVFLAADLVYQGNSLALLALAVLVFGRAVWKRYPYSKPLGLGFLTFLSIALSVMLFNNDRIYRGGFSVLSFLYPLFGIDLSSSFAVDIASYAIALLGLNAFCVLFFVDAPKIERPASALAEQEGRDKAKEKCERMGLSPREAEVALLLLDGKRNKEIAEALFVSENTIKTHLARIFSKAKVKARSELFAIFSRSA